MALSLKHSLPLVVLAGFTATSCTTAYKQSIGANREQVKSRVFTADMNIVWQAVLDSLKSTRLDVSNREAGVVQTKWTDNTAERNFSDSEGGTFPYVKAQYRFRVSLLRGMLGGTPAIKVSIQREQLVQRDALDELRHQESDLIEEKTLLYRIGRIVKVKTELARLEEERTQQELNQSEFLQEGGTTSGSLDQGPPLEEGPVGEAPPADLPPPLDGDAGGFIPDAEEP